MAPFEAAARGDGGDRAGGAGDDAEPGRDLHPGLVHVEHLGALPLPVRHHGGGGGPGQPARLVHADADDERAAAPAREDAARSTTTPHSRARVLRAASTASTTRCSRCAMRHRLAVSRRRRCVVMLSSMPLYRVVRQEFVPSDVDEARVRGERRRARKARASPRWTRRCGAVEKRAAAGAAASGRCSPTIGGGFLGGVNQAQRLRRASRRTRSACSRSAASGHGDCRTLDPLEAFQGNYSQRDVMQQVRGAAAEVHGPARRRCATLQSFNLGGGNFDIDFAIRGPELEALAEYAEQLRASAPTSSASSTPTRR